MSSDVCKHCTHAACLDVCPTGALFRTEFDTVVVQPDVCNGCGYCVPACPFGVIDRREDDGRAWKCTMCYDRQLGGLEPACAKACPTDSIQFGPLDELRERAEERVDAPARRRATPRPGCTARAPTTGWAAAGAFFLLLDEPEVYGLPPDPVVTTRDLPAMWRWAGAAALSGGGRRGPRLSGHGRAAVTRERAHGARGGVPVLLRPAGDQGARLARTPHAGISLSGGSVRGFVRRWPSWPG